MILFVSQSAFFGRYVCRNEFPHQRAYINRVVKHDVVKMIYLFSEIRRKMRQIVNIDQIVRRLFQVGGIYQQFFVKFFAGTKAGLDNLDVDTGA